MSFYIIFFVVSFIGIELSSFALRIIRYDVSFTDSSFYLGDFQSHLINLGFVTFIVITFYFNKRKIRDEVKYRTQNVFNGVSALYFMTVLLMFIYALINSEVVIRLSLANLIVGCALLSLLIVSFNLAVLIKNKGKVF